MTQIKEEEATLTTTDSESLYDVVWIVGVGRSGTSLLHSMLDAHPAITFLPETHFYRYYVARKRIRSRFERGGPVRFESQLNSDPHFSRAGIAPDELLRPYVEDTEVFDLARVYARLLDLYRVQAGAQIVGDKDPRNIDYIESALAQGRRILVVHAIRDPRDVVLSRMKASWSSSRPFVLNALVCDAQFSHGRSVGRRLGAHYVETHYERLLEDPERELRMLTRAIGVDFSTQMLENFGESARRLTDASEAAWKSNTFGPLIGDNTAKWVSSLPPWKVATVECICRAYFRGTGYQLSGNKAVRASIAPLLILPKLVFRLLYRLVIRFSLLKNQRDVI